MSTQNPAQEETSSTAQEDKKKAHPAFKQAQELEETDQPAPPEFDSTEEQPTQTSNTGVEANTITEPDTDPTTDSDVDADTHSDEDMDGTEEAAASNTAKGTQSESGTTANTDSTEDTEQTPDSTNEGSESSPSTTSKSESLSGNGIVNASPFAKFSSRIETVLEEAVIHIGESGLYVESVDPTNVQMANVELSSEAFETYAFDQDEFGIALEKISDSTSLMKSTESISLNIADEGSTLQLTDNMLSFNRSLIDTEYIEETEIPDFEFGTIITLENSKLRRFIKSANIIESSSGLQLEADNSSNAVTLISEGSEDDTKEKFTSDSADIEKVSDARSRYSIDILKQIVTEFPKSATITLSFADDYPISLKAKEEDGDLSTEYIIAPRVKTD